jgi:molybdate transport system ATP-binding protein
VARQPRSPYVAELVGVNLLSGTAVGDHTVRLQGGAELVVADAVPSPEVAVAVRPQAVTVHRHRPDSSARNTWPATVADLAADHDRVRVQLVGPVPLVAEVTPAAVADLDLTPGAEVWVSMKAVDLAVYEH